MFNWYDHDTILTAVKSSRSTAEVLRRLGLPHQGGHYRRLGEWAAQNNVSLPVYERQFQPRVPDENIFIEGSLYRNNTGIKERLVKVYDWSYLCMGEGCPHPEPIWAGKPITLQLDHVDGDSSNNSFENLRFLCPNCHTQTETYGSKNSKVIRKHNFCPCGAEITLKAANCTSCEAQSRTGVYKVSWPTPDVLISMVESSTYTEVANTLGCSDNAIKKHLKSLGIEPPRKYKR